jgi:hypothetical protein
VGAAECASHLGAEVLADTIAGEPGTGAAVERGVLVGGVGFGTDDDDAIDWEGVQRFATATPEVTRLDDQQVGRVRRERVGEGPPILERRRGPTAVFSGEEFRDEAA